MPTELEIIEWREELIDKIKIRLVNGDFISDDILKDMLDDAEKLLNEFFALNNDYSKIIGTIMETHLKKMVRIMAEKSGVESVVAENSVGRSRSFSNTDAVYAYLAPYGYVIR